MARIDGIKLKIERAKKHTADLDDAIRRFCQSDFYKIGAKPHRIPAIRHTTLYLSELKPIPESISLGIGDAVHNLRSSLDHLAWQLVEAGGGTPGSRTAFPICHGRNAAQQFSSAIGQGELKRMVPGAQKVLNAVQPYVTEDDTLWHIHHLDIVDKHRLIVTAVLRMTSWVANVDIGSIAFDRDNPVPLVLGDEISNIPTSTYERTGHKNFELRADIAFGEREISENKPVLEILGRMADLTSQIIRKFEPYLV